MRKTLAISLAALLVLVGLQAAFATGAMVVEPPAHGAMVMTDIATAGDPYAGPRDNRCDFDACAFSCVTAALAEPGGRCTPAWRVLPAGHPRLAERPFAGHDRPPPSPPPRLTA